MRPREPFEPRHELDPETGIAPELKALGVFALGFMVGLLVCALLFAITGLASAAESRPSPQTHEDFQAQENYLRDRALESELLQRAGE